MRISRLSARRGPAGAERTAEIFRDAGYGTVELLPLPEGPPAVYAEAAGPADSPTVLLYAHYDIQPPGDLDAWDSPPFEPEVRDGRLYGRGAADDKSGVAIHAAVMRAFAGRPPCTVRVIVEGEEECGVPSRRTPAPTRHCSTPTPSWWPMWEPRSG